MLIKALLVTLVYFFGRCEWLLGSGNIRRPIVLGTLTGIVLGHPAEGAIMGAFLELAFLGAMSIGASMPPEMISGTVLGVSLAIVAGANPETAVALGVPIASLLLVVNTVLNQPIIILFCHRADYYAEKGDDKGIARAMFLSGMVPTLIMLPIIFCGFYFGSEVVTQALGFIPAWIQAGVKFGCNMIPAIGFAMLAQMIFDKKLAPYFFIGYFLVQYFGTPTMGVAIFAVLIAILLGYSKANAMEMQRVTEVDDNEF